MGFAENSTDGENVSPTAIVVELVLEIFGNTMQDSVKVTPSVVPIHSDELTTSKPTPEACVLALSFCENAYHGTITNTCPYIALAQNAALPIIENRAVETPPTNVPMCSPT